MMVGAAAILACARTMFFGRVSSADRRHPEGGTIVFLVNQLIAIQDVHDLLKAITVVLFVVLMAVELLVILVIHFVRPTAASYPTSSSNWNQTSPRPRSGT